jgi:hypothetical protein
VHLYKVRVGPPGISCSDEQIRSDPQRLQYVRTWSH